MESVIAAAVTGILALTGVIVTNISGNRSMQGKLEKAQAVTETRLEELTREVREHNGFARRMPVLEEKIKSMGHRLETLEQKKTSVSGSRRTEFEGRMQ